jgi:hypothetical protein
MRKLILLCAFWISFLAAAMAQDHQVYPRGEVFIGYSHELADVSRSRVDLNGFHVSAVENVNSWFGGVLDFSAHFTTVNGTVVDNETVAFGPQFAYRKMKSILPSAHVALGVAHGSQAFLGNSTSGTHFAFVGGGALDYAPGSKFAIRIIEGDLIKTKFQDLTRNNVRLSAGVVFYVR